MISNKKAELLAFATILGFLLITLASLYFALFYGPTPERNYFIDMYQEQQAERDAASKQINKLMNLQLLKEEVAQDNGYPDWNALVNEMVDPIILNFHLDILLRRYAELVTQHNLNRVAERLPLGVPQKDTELFMPLVEAIGDVIRCSEIELL